MGINLEQLAAECHQILAKESGPGGREQARQVLQKALLDDDFVDTHLGPDNTAPRKILYEDSDLGFCICAHVYEGAKDSEPHDHGPSWAIYGQAKGKTTMTEWRVVRPSQNGSPAAVESAKVYEMERGDAAVYDFGDVHSPSRSGPTRLIRIEGMNLDNVTRDNFLRA